jgi:hypothetical protein
MIVTTKKDFEEVEAALKGYDNIILFHCGTCSVTSQTSDEKSVKEMVENLKNAGKNVIHVQEFKEPCDYRLDIQELRDTPQESLEKVDAFLILSCGVGLQAMLDAFDRKNIDKPIFMALNTHGIAETERIGRFHVKCFGCGDCLLNYTGGICPITSCAKSLMNGPCGGQIDGKCEVGNYERDCGWILIYNRLKKIGRLDLFGELRSSFNWSDRGKQKSIVFR